MKLIEEFENCTLPKEEWTHANHFVMALWYCIKYPLPEAVQKISGGIRGYNESVGGVNTEDAGYHETITLFYISTIAGYVVTRGVMDFNEEVVGEFLRQPFLDREYVWGYYSKERLMSKEARLGWRAPDKG